MSSPKHDSNNLPSYGAIHPMDEHNEVLLSNVHPPQWNNPSPKGRYNLVVVGAGTAGLVAAAGAAGLGAKVALIERHLMGGDCLNVGCVPSKSIISSARCAALINRASEFGLNVQGEPQVDFPAVMERVRKIRADISGHDSAQRFSSLGVDVFIGHGRFESSSSISVAGSQLKFKKAVIATGARAEIPSIDGLAEARCLSNENVFNLTQLPRRLAVIGAGPIGCELAQTFQRLGSSVTLLNNQQRIMPREDSDAAELLQKTFIREGINLLLNSEVLRVEKSDGGKLVHYALEGKESSIEVDEILIGVGRTPNVDGLNLEAANVKYDSRQGVIVDDNLRTSNPSIFAAGDICMKYKFTHAADFAARIVIQNALFFGRKKLSALTIPWCTYTSPEIAHVGLSQHDANNRGIAIETYRRDLADVDRAIADGETAGFVKIHCKRGSDQILGATIAAAHAGEMISEINLAMVNKIGLGKLANVIHPYPTQAEAIRQLGDQYNRTRLTPLIKSLFNAILKITR